VDKRRGPGSGASRLGIRGRGAVDELREWELLTWWRSWQRRARSERGRRFGGFVFEC